MFPVGKFVGRIGGLSLTICELFSLVAVGLSEHLRMLDLVGA